MLFLPAAIQRITTNARRAQGKRCPIPFPRSTKPLAAQNRTPCAAYSFLPRPYFNLSHGIERVRFKSLQGQDSEDADGRQHSLFWRPRRIERRGRLTSLPPWSRKGLSERSSFSRISLRNIASPDLTPPQKKILENRLQIYIRQNAIARPISRRSFRHRVGPSAGSWNPQEAKKSTPRSLGRHG